MGEGPVWRPGGGQPGYFGCSHGGCQAKARNVDPWGRSPELLSGDHACCGRTRHTTAHAYQDRARGEAEAAGAAGSPGLVTLLVTLLVRRVLERR